VAVAGAGAGPPPAARSRSSYDDHLTASVAVLSSSPSSKAGKSTRLLDRGRSEPSLIMDNKENTFLQFLEYCSVLEKLSDVEANKIARDLSDRLRSGSSKSVLIKSPVKGHTPPSTDYDKDTATPTTAVINTAATTTKTTNTPKSKSAPTSTDGTFTRVNAGANTSSESS
jgi:hypothetical protein